MGNSLINSFNDLWNEICKTQENNSIKEKISIFISEYFQNINEIEKQELKKILGELGFYIAINGKKREEYSKILFKLNREYKLDTQKQLEGDVKRSGDDNDDIMTHILNYDLDVFRNKNFSKTEIIEPYIDNFVNYLESTKFTNPNKINIIVDLFILFEFECWDNFEKQFYIFKNVANIDSRDNHYSRKEMYNIIRDKYKKALERINDNE